MNPFNIEEEATRYQKYRPRYHHIPFGMIRDYVGKNFDLSLDVACGTGQSTDALSKVSNKVIGCDLSESMLKEAKKNYKHEFRRAKAENLPFENGFFNFLNISMGFHWVDQEQFLKEAKRVLKKNGYLAIDNYGFSGKISDNVETQKLHNDFLKEYLPNASKRPSYPTEELIKSLQMILIKEMNYDHKVSMNAAEFINLLMTWSNFQILSEDKKITTAKKMNEIYEKIFDGRKQDLAFSGKTLIYTFSH